MTLNLQPTARTRRISRTKKSDALRVLGNLSGLIGGFFILGAAGASDLNLISFGDIVLRMVLGTSLLLLWRVISFVAAELEKEAHRR